MIGLPLLVNGADLFGVIRMPTVTLSETLDARMQRLARPFETREMLIERLVRSVAPEELRGNGHPTVERDQPALPLLDPDRHPSLKHTKLLSASADGKVLYRPKWNGLMDHLHTLCLNRLKSVDAVKQASEANVRTGKYEADGFHFVEEAGLSVQGSDADNAWKHTLQLVRFLAIEVDVIFEWRDKPGAARRGQKARMRWSPGDTPR